MSLVWISHSCIGMKGVEKDINKAIQTYAKSCNEKFYEACHNLGWLFGFDMKDYISAVIFYNQACEAKYHRSCFSLANLYKDGKGLEKDVIKAKQVRETAINNLTQECSANNNQSCLELGSKYELGYGIKKDINKALKLYEKACNAKISGACKSLADIYEDGKDIKKDANKALQYHKKACQLEKQSCYRVGIMYRDGGAIKQDYAQAAKFFKMSCDANNFEACGFLAALYYYGNGVKKDLFKAILLNDKVCKSDHYANDRACYELGMMHLENGNKQEARAFFKKVCDKDAGGFDFFGYIKKSCDYYNDLK